MLNTVLLDNSTYDQRIRNERPEQIFVLNNAININRLTCGFNICNTLFNSKFTCQLISLFHIVYPQSPHEIPSSIATGKLIPFS